MFILLSKQDSDEKVPKAKSVFVAEQKSIS